jgi:hypothetical protein
MAILTLVTVFLLIQILNRIEPTPGDGNGNEARQMKGDGKM